MIAQIIVEKMDGKKTYTAGAGLIIVGVAGGITGLIPVTEAIQLVFEGLGFIGLKNAFVKKG